MRPAHETKRGRELGGQEKTPGYAANGESEYSRHASHGANTAAAKMRLRDTQSLTRLDAQILHELYEVSRLERKVMAETDPMRVAKAIENLGKTKKFLDRLRAEQRGLAT